MTIFVMIWISVSVVINLSTDRGYVETQWFSEEKIDFRFTGGTYGLETLPSHYWLSDGPLVLELRNRSNRQLGISIRIHFGSTPCGGLVSVKSIKPKSLNYTWDREQSLLYVLLLVAAGSKEIVEINKSGSACSVPNEPRLFYGSILDLDVMQSDQT